MRREGKGRKKNNVRGRGDRIYTSQEKQNKTQGPEREKLSEKEQQSECMAGLGQTSITH